jgi:hypothetical protein
MQKLLKNISAELEVLGSKDERLNEVIGYLETVTKDQGSAIKYTINGDEVIVGK